jgi:hypothetical protein
VTIAQVHGYCLGGALGIMNMHDIVVAADDAQLGMPEILRGSFGQLVTSTLLNGRIPIKKVTWMQLVGRNISGAEADRLGVVSHSVPGRSWRRRPFRSRARSRRATWHPWSTPRSRSRWVAISPCRRRSSSISWWVQRDIINPLNILANLQLGASGLFPGFLDAIQRHRDVLVKYVGIARRHLDVGVVERLLYQLKVAGLAQNLGREIMSEVVKPKISQPGRCARTIPESV